MGVSINCFVLALIGIKDRGEKGQVGTWLFYGNA